MTVKLRSEVLEFDGSRANEEGVGEQGVPRRVGNDADRHPIRALRTGETVEDVQLSSVQIASRFVEKPVEQCRLDLLVDVAPVDMAGGISVVDDEAVLRRSARRFSRLHDERAVSCEYPLASGERARDELGWRKIAVDTAGAGETQLGELLPDHVGYERSRRHLNSPPLVVSRRDTRRQAG